VHEVLQQTPSTQLPEPHSLAVVQVELIGFEHVPAPFALQTWPVGHASTPQHTPSVHLPEPHCEAEVQTVPRAPVVTHEPESQK
jgi:hypothetical protein